MEDCASGLTPGSKVPPLAQQVDSLAVIAAQDGALRPLRNTAGGDYAMSAFYATRGVSLRDVVSPDRP
jgi:hypothetical protein